MDASERAHMRIMEWAKELQAASEVRAQGRARMDLGFMHIYFQIV